MHWLRGRHAVKTGAVGSTAALIALSMAATLTTAQAGPAPTSEDGSELAIATVKAPTGAERERLFESGLDILESSAGDVEILLHGQDDRQLLAQEDVDAEVVSADAQVAQMNAARQAEERLAQQAEADPSLESPLPTGRVSYRTIEDAELEMRRIARQHRDIAKFVKLPNRSLLGRPVQALELSRDVDTYSGKPVFLTSGVHHAREWPTVELTLEFAWEVVQKDGIDPQITELLDTTRVIVVPVVNPDGYTMSRLRIDEMKRKNCRINHGEIPTWEECADPDNHALGVDLNRNYGPFWGGPGSSSDITASNHHGEAPYSEPTIQNMEDLMSSHQVTVAVNNHTPDARLLRAPSSPLEPVPADEEMYDALAQELGEALSWPAGPWPDIYYVASGVAEQHGLYATGTFGFTPELTPGHSGLERFHPPYEYVIDQYFGTGYYEGSSFREAMLIAWEAAADPDKHSVIEGSAPAGVELTISKDITVDSSPLEREGVGDVVVQSDLELETTMTVPDSGTFEWHVNPSYRPSQYVTGFLEESWLVSCQDRAGKVHKQVEVTVARGQSVDIDMRGCPAGPAKGRGANG